jgi:hypothetical protein
MSQWNFLVVMLCVISGVLFNISINLSSIKSVLERIEILLQKKQ